VLEGPEVSEAAGVGVGVGETFSNC
jgi:hypothetical protein